MAIPPAPSLQQLLDLTLSELGLNAAGCTDADWKQVAGRLNDQLSEWLGDVLGRALVRLGCDSMDRLYPVPFLFEKRFLHVGGVILRPPDSFYLRKDQPWAKAPEGSQGGELHLRVQLMGARPCSIPDRHLSPVVSVELNVGYRSCPPLQWLITHWRRPLEKLLLPLKADVYFNGHENTALKAFRGKDVVRKAELYLGDPGNDPFVTWQLDFHGNSREDEPVRALSVFVAIYDALYSLQVPRCDPDRLHKHFLKLENSLPALPFRDGFYDPGQTMAELTADWNRRNPENPMTV